MAQYYYKGDDDPGNPEWKPDCFVSASWSSEDWSRDDNRNGLLDVVTLTADFCSKTLSGDWGQHDYLCKPPISIIGSCTLLRKCKNGYKGGRKQLWHYGPTPMGLGSDAMIDTILRDIR